MIKYLITFLVSGLLFLSCGKKQDSNTTTNTGTTNNNKVQDTKTTKELPSLIDFNWKEGGKDFKLSDYKGKVILLNFWATWCGPCKREIPALSQISSELKNKDFKLIGVSVDDNREDLDVFLKAFKIDYTVVHEPNQLVNKYMEATGQVQNVVPQTYVIDKNGRIVETILGARSKADFLTILNKHL